MFSFLLWPRTFSLTKMTAHASNTGLLPSTRDKAQLYDAVAAAFAAKKTVLDSFTAITQVGGREGLAVCSPEGMHDDQVDNNVLAAGACQRNSPLLLAPPQDPPSGQLLGRDGEKWHNGSRKATTGDVDQAHGNGC